MTAAEYIDAMKICFSRNNRIKDIPGHNGKVHALGWNNDGSRLASGAVDRNVITYVFDSNRAVKDSTLKGHNDSVDQLRWHPKERDILCSTGSDGTIRLWDVRSRRGVSNLSLKGEFINLSWSPNGSVLAAGNKDDTVYWVDTRTMTVNRSEQYKFEVNEVSWNTHGDSFFLTTGQGCVYVYNYPELKLEQIIKAHPATAICLQFDPTGRYFAVGSADAVVSVWNANELVCIRTINRLEWPVRTLGFSHDGQMVAAASEDNFIDISEAETGEQIQQIMNPRSSATFVLAWHPKCHILAYSNDEKHDRDRESCIKLFGLPSE